MNYLNYNLHLLLNSKHYLIYKLIILIFIYQIYTNDITFIECMNQGSPPPSPTPIAPRPENSNFIEYIQHLVYENAYLRQRLEALEIALQTEIRQHTIDNACSNRTINNLLHENLNLQEQIDQINNEISVAAELVDNTQNTSVESIQDQSHNDESDLYPSII